MALSASSVCDRAPALPVDTQLGADPTKDLVGQVVDVEASRAGGAAAPLV
jgi:hypothetical protein